MNSVMRLGLRASYVHITVHATKLAQVADPWAPALRLLLRRGERWWWQRQHSAAGVGNGGAANRATIDQRVELREHRVGRRRHRYPRPPVALRR